VADEISVSGKVRVAKGFIELERKVNFTADMAGTHYSQNAQTIGFAAHEALEISTDVATAGVSYLKNLDATNYVEIGVVVSATFYPVIRLLPGESYPVRFSVLTLYAKAHTAAVVLEHLIVEA
jgi:hypothetical protein